MNALTAITRLRFINSVCITSPASLRSFGMSVRNFDLSKALRPEKACVSILRRNTRRRDVRNNVLHRAIYSRIRLLPNKLSRQQYVMRKTLVCAINWRYQRASFLDVRCRGPLMGQESDSDTIARRAKRFDST